MSKDIVQIDQEIRQEIVYQFSSGLEEQYAAIHEMLRSINEIAAREKYEPLYKLVVSYTENTYEPAVDMLLQHCQDWRESEGSVLSLLYAIYASAEGDENESIISGRQLEEDLEETIRSVFKKSYQPIAISTETSMTQSLSATFEEILDRIATYRSKMENAAENYRKLFAYMDEENAVCGRVEILFAALLVDIGNLVDALETGVKSIDEFLNEQATAADNTRANERDSMIKKAESTEQAFEELSSLFQFM